MQDTLMEQLQKTVEFAVEERAKQYGPHYLSSLEGYGDIHRQLVGMMASMKETKSACGDLVGYINLTDPQELLKALGKLDGRCKLLTYECLRMCETVERYKRTIKHCCGGDLMDILDGFGPMDDENEEENDDE